MDPLPSFSGVLQSYVCVYYGVWRVENHCRSLHPEPVGGEDEFSDGVCSIGSPLNVGFSFDLKDFVLQIGVFQRVTNSSGS